MELIELLTLLPGVGVCATTGALFFALAPLAVGMDEPPDVWASRVAGGGLVWADFFFPNKKDMLRCTVGAINASSSFVKSG